MFLRNVCKVIPVTGSGGPLGCETLRLPRLLDSRFTDGGEVSLTCPERFLLFLLEAEPTPGP
jgi:hypothetical protein